MDIYIHIGYPKAGSTNLQKKLFQKHSELAYFGQQNINSIQNKQEIEIYRKKLNKFYDNLLHLSGIEYEYCKDTKLIEAVQTLPTTVNKTSLFTNEDILNPYYSDNALKAYRLKKIFPNAKIVVILRDQIDVLVSWYNMIVPPFKISNIFSFQKITLEKWIHTTFQPPHIYKGVLPSLLYYETACLYQNLFGKENVGIFLFEEMSNEVNTFTKKLATFLGIDYAEAVKLMQTNRAFNTAEENQFLKYRKLFLPKVSFKKFMPNLVYDIIVGGTIKPYLSQKKASRNHLSLHTIKKLCNYFHSSNKKLSKNLKLNIQKYGYPLNE